MSIHRSRGGENRQGARGWAASALALGALAFCLVAVQSAPAQANRSGNPAIAAAAQTPAGDAPAELDQARIQIQDLQVQVVQLKERLRAALQWKLVRELEDEVSRIRNLPLKKHVAMETLSSEQTRQLIRRLVGKDMPDSVAIPAQRALILLGALPPGTNLRQTLIDLFSEQVGGLYDDSTGKLYVTAQFNPDSSIGKVVLAHEICHALQDQNFDLSRYPIHVTDNDDQAYAASSALEGDATVLMTHYMMKNLSLSWLIDLPKALSIDQGKFNAAPHYLQYLLIFPYIEGMNLIMRADEISDTARDSLLQNPPLSTEQVLHPEKYFSKEYDGPVAVEAADLSSALGPGWAMRGQNTHGEEGIRAILMHDQPLKLNYFSTRPLSVDPKIVEAAAGWGGDRAAIWMKDGAADTDANAGQIAAKAAERDNAAEPAASAEVPAVVHWRIVWDTDRDAYEFRKYALSTWLPSILPGAKEVVLDGTENARAWTDPKGLWGRIQWEGNQVDLLIGEGDGSEVLLTKGLPR